MSNETFTTPNAKTTRAPSQTASPQLDVASNAPGSNQILADALRHVGEKMAPVWPLKDYVAVNPYMGFSGTEFLATREYLRSLSDLELFMPVDYYREQFQEGDIERQDIAAAVDELVSDGVPGAERIDVNQVVRFLQEDSQGKPTADAEFTVPSNPSRTLFSVSETIDAKTGSSYCELILEEVSKQCATHYDEGQSAWSSSPVGQGLCDTDLSGQSPVDQGHSLFAAWRSDKSHDLTLEILGIAGFRKFVQQLPADAADAVSFLLQKLQAPAELWSDYLLCSALTTPGWSAWAKYQHRQADIEERQCDDLTGLLAIRLAYEVAVIEHLNFDVDWQSIQKRHAEHAEQLEPTTNDLWRYALLRAGEISFRNQLVKKISAGQAESANTSGTPSTRRKLAQMVFCIDVRSERIRRHLEVAAPEVDTFGFAGFFGLPLEFVELGAKNGKANVPALISPSFQVKEELDGKDGDTNVASTEAIRARRAKTGFFQAAWKRFQSSSVSMFAFVETTGLLYSWKLLRRSLRLPSRSESAGQANGSTSTASRLSPSLRGLEEQGIDRTQQIDMAESVLRGIGIVDNFARLVVFCGHGSQVVNNPLQAGLDCGACGGHSGEPNARFAAKLLNQPEVRQGLSNRGIEIPDDTWFVPATHNTTTDSIDFFDEHQLPVTHAGDLAQLKTSAAVATKLTRTERAPLLSSKTLGDVVRRSADWSEVRPEWGLAGNAAFVVGPRELTKHASLQGRAFLHSYNYENDPQFAVLEQIITAPMVVANWINMQYYASTVDPVHFGSGNKTVHNVVGQFGILSGNGGDLKTGLPWQSLHDGAAYQHHPLRLLVVLAAPRNAIGSILEKHPAVASLATNGWLQLLSHDAGRFFRFTERRTWEEVCE